MEDVVEIPHDDSEKNDCHSARCAWHKFTMLESLCKSVSNRSGIQFGL